MMKEIRTEDAVGHILCHDITQIIKDKKKGVLFKKGHIVREEDIPALLSVGKEHLFVWEKKEGILHENEGAGILFKICAGENMHGTDVSEGKIELIADCPGLLKIRRDALNAVNGLGEMMIASRHGDFPVKKGDKIAGTRIIPLVIEKEKMDRAVEAAGEEPIFSVLPFRQKKVGIVTTGSEVKKGLIKDTFTPVLREKLSEYPAEIIGQTLPGDDREQITSDILRFAKEGAGLINSQRRYERGSRRQDARSDQRYGSRDHHLRRAGSAGSHAPDCVSEHERPEHSRAWASRMCHVCEKNGV